MAHASRRSGAGPPGAFCAAAISFVLDFGSHLVGHLAFDLSGDGDAVDAPVRLRLTFGEVPGDVAIPIKTYSGTLARAWLPEEIVNVDFLPQRVQLPRRHTFRYVKVDLIHTSPNFGARFANFEAVSVTSARNEAPPLRADIPELLRELEQSA